MRTPCPRGLDPDRWRTVVAVAMESLTWLTAPELEWIVLYGSRQVFKAMPVKVELHGKGEDPVVSEPKPFVERTS